MGKENTHIYTNSWCSSNMYSSYVIGELRCLCAHTHQVVNHTYILQLIWFYFCAVLKAPRNKQNFSYNVSSIKWSNAACDSTISFRQQTSKCRSQQEQLPGLCEP